MKLHPVTVEAIKLLEPFGYESHLDEDGVYTVKLYRNNKIVGIAAGQDFLETVKQAVNASKGK